MQEIEKVYLELLQVFPGFLRPLISIGLTALLVYSILQTLKRNVVYIIVLIVLLPASIPILKSAVSGVIAFIRFLLGTV